MGRSQFLIDAAEWVSSVDWYDYSDYYHYQLYVVQKHSSVCLMHVACIVYVVGMWKAATLTDKMG